MTNSTACSGSSNRPAGLMVDDGRRGTECADDAAVISEAHKMHRRCCWLVLSADLSNAELGIVCWLGCGDAADCTQ